MSDPSQPGNKASHAHVTAVERSGSGTALNNTHPGTTADFEFLRAAYSTDAMKTLTSNELKKMINGTYKPALEPFPAPQQDFGVIFTLEVPKEDHGLLINDGLAYNVVDILAMAMHQALQETYQTIQVFAKKEDTKTNRNAHVIHLAFPEAASGEEVLTSIQQNARQITLNINTILEEQEMMTGHQTGSRARH